MNHNENYSEGPLAWKFPSETRSSGVSVSVLNCRKNTSKKKKYSSLSRSTVLSTNDITDLFKRAKNRKQWLQDLNWK